MGLIGLDDETVVFGIDPEPASESDDNVASHRCFSFP
jgi:hypothetical protein